MLDVSKKILSGCFPRFNKLCAHLLLLSACHSCSQVSEGPEPGMDAPAVQEALSGRAIDTHLKENSSREIHVSCKTCKQKHRSYINTWGLTKVFNRKAAEPKSISWVVRRKWQEGLFPRPWCWWLGRHQESWGFGSSSSSVPASLSQPVGSCIGSVLVWQWGKAAQVGHGRTYSEQGLSGAGK